MKYYSNVLIVLGLVLPLTLATQAFATHERQIVIMGTVKNIAPNYVEIQTESGTIKVPRSAISKSTETLRPNHPVRAKVDPAELVALN